MRNGSPKFAGIRTILAFFERCIGLHAAAMQITLPLGFALFLSACTSLDYSQGSGQASPSKYRPHSHSINVVVKSGSPVYNLKVTYGSWIIGVDDRPIGGYSVRKPGYWNSIGRTQPVEDHMLVEWFDEANGPVNAARLEVRSRLEDPGKVRRLELEFSTNEITLFSYYPGVDPRFADRKLKVQSVSRNAKTGN